MNLAVFSINKWEKRKARKQQFALAFSQMHEVRRVLYVEPAMNAWRLMLFPWRELRDRENRQRWLRALTGGLKVINDKLSVYTPLAVIPFGFRCQTIYNWNSMLLSHAVSRLLPDMDDTVLWLYQPLDYKMLDFFKPRRLALFDWAEEWSEYFVEFGPEKRMRVRALEDHLIRNCDIVLVVSRKMLLRAKELNPASAYVIDGTVPEVFARQGKTNELSYLPKPVCGYIGTLSHRIDVDLLRLLATKFRHVTFVFIGDVHKVRFDAEPLRELANVIFIGGLEYSDLGLYAPGVDLWLLPYRPELTESFPTKVFDYLATGKPIVSTRLEALEAFQELVYMGESHDAIAGLFQVALEESDHELSQKRTAVARQNSWARRAGEIMDMIQKKSGL